LKLISAVGKGSIFRIILRIESAGKAEESGMEKSV